MTKLGESVCKHQVSTSSICPECFEDRGFKTLLPFEKEQMDIDYHGVGPKKVNDAITVGELVYYLRELKSVYETLNWNKYSFYERFTKRLQELDKGIPDQVDLFKEVFGEV